MSKKKFIVLCVLLFIQSGTLGAISAVTYTFSGGRFGDNLIAYSHAKWISYVHKIPLLCKSFPYSDQLMLDSIEQKYDERNNKNYKKVHVLKSRDFTIDANANILYVVPYFAESEYDLVDPHYPPYFSVDWNNQEFVNELKHCIKPKQAISQIKTPEGYVSVAVHMRKGTGYDGTMFPMNCPHKSCPDSYYIEQLAKLADHFYNKQLLVHIFTDHDKPLELVRLLNKKVGRKNITYECREKDNRHNNNVLEDFFGLTQFDCLLRSDSNFSLMASKLSNYMVHIYPVHYSKVGNEIVVDQVKVEIR